MYISSGWTRIATALWELSNFIGSFESITKIFYLI